LNFLWVIDFDYEKRLHHGGFIRFFNFAPELISQGHTVTFAVNFIDPDPQPSIEYFKQLKAQGVFTDFIEVNFRAPRWRLRVAALSLYPWLANVILRPAQKNYAARVDTIIRDRGLEVVVISPVRLLFLQQVSRSRCAFIFDLGDCLTLYVNRQIRVLRKNGDWRGIRRVLRDAIFAYGRELYYGRMKVMKMMVSPVDKEAIDQISKRPDTSVAILNGVRDGAPRGRYSKTPGRVIFTGNMDFPPNYEAALWFLDNVFPLVLSKRSDACFVIAGANPTPALLERASKNVLLTGYVDDLNREIASSEIFVAPLISGGGFKNKVVEAIVNRTSVIATSIAVEFLDAELRGLLAVADSPEDIAAAMMDIWRDPEAAAARAETLHDLVVERFGWAGKAAEIAAVAKRELARI
jgi:glycosyltransferase involved in cell wall biosynthesis